MPQQPTDRVWCELCGYVSQGWIDNQECPHRDCYMEKPMPTLSAQIARDIREGMFPKKSEATLTEERTWKCSGCGKPAPDRKVNCDCTTSVLFRQEYGAPEHTTKLDPIQCRIEEMRVYVDEGGQLSHANGLELLALVEQQFAVRRGE